MIRHHVNKRLYTQWILFIIVRTYFKKRQTTELQLCHIIKDIKLKKNGLFQIDLIFSNLQIPILKLSKGSIWKYQEQHIFNQSYQSIKNTYIKKTSI